MNEAIDRKQKLTGALMDVRAGAGKQADDAVSWPLLLVDAVLRSESAGSADRQDELIEAIGVLLGLGVEESLPLAEAAERLSGDRSRSFIIAALHRQQQEAEEKVAALRAERESDPDPDGRTDLVAQSCRHQGVIEALGYTIELVNLSALPSDNDQQIGELITVADAKLLEDVISGDDGPETEEVRLLRRRLHKLAERATA